ncbi:LacI family transcriptional regulator [Mycetocola sp. BIGb0189]|uniref:LacI family DNA-binding transcriptional regulator n=1 Tax=Mycetocola sp. BIGb0189 TaxID=2940604 RepID=UPI002167530C|nr:LacI family DNA-binding transcriptional regulator [Mycetocola sp. BIGb0189]MCS4276646.1 LacI family transcriptional regulator [Mycetocola sp. BIGb0189]
MATGRDVAQLAGTSTAVVSYVFNNGPRNVSPETRERVLAAAAELNYQPNALARALSAGKTSSIGLIVPNIANPYFGELARALEDAALAHNHLLIIADSAGNPEQETRHCASFLGRRVDGVILVSLFDNPDLSAFRRENVPVLVLHPIDHAHGVSSLTIDYEAAARDATAHLLDHGYDSIGMLNGLGETAGAQQHRAGFEAALARHAERNPGITVRAEERPAEISRAAAARIATAWLAEPDRPRAIYSTTDEQAFGVLYAAHVNGLRVPEDLAIVGFDGTEQTEFAVPPLTTIAQPIRQISNRAIELLVRYVPDSPVHELFAYTLTRRSSCGCEPG